MWSTQELKILKKEFGKHILKDLHEKFLPNKSPGQIRTKASELNLTTNLKWSEKDEKALMLLRKNGVSYPIISEILDRDKQACVQKASKMGYGF